MAAASHGPGTVRELAQRSCVGYDAARFKVPALVRSGVLTATSDTRPRVYQVQERPTRVGDGGFVLLNSSFWAPLD